MTEYEWICPHCDRHQMVTDRNQYTNFSRLHFGETIDGNVGIFVKAIRCLNANCNEPTIEAQYLKVERQAGDWVPVDLLQNWCLLPESSSRPQPQYIPLPLREDYYEACLIRDKSPKASATLARRCLQGMIRDFCGISKSRLIDEIQELRKRLDEGHAPKGVEPETLEAIDAVRNLGNIGAHMERDINLIVDVDPSEAQALIELIEMLFQDWYVARNKREQRLASVKAMAAEKKAIIDNAKERDASV